MGGIPGVSGAFGSLWKALLGERWKAQVVEQVILSGAPPGRTKERVHGRRISYRRMFRAPESWYPVLLVREGKIIGEHWERD